MMRSMIEQRILSNIHEIPIDLLHQYAERIQIIDNGYLCKEEKENQNEEKNDKKKERTQQLYPGMRWLNS